MAPQALPCCHVSTAAAVPAEPRRRLHTGRLQRRPQIRQSHPYCRLRLFTVRTPPARPACIPWLRPYTVRLGPADSLCGRSRENRPPATPSRTPRGAHGALTVEPSVSVSRSLPSEYDGSDIAPPGMELRKAELGVTQQSYSQSFSD